MATTLRAAWIDPDYRREPLGNGPHCCRCNRKIKGRPRYVHLIGDAPWAIHKDDEPFYLPDSGGDLGVWPIGPDCAKIIGIEYTIDPR